MARIITAQYKEQFYSDGREVLGYLIGGELNLDITEEIKENFVGDWSKIRQADVWSMVHNSDCLQSVTFWSEDGKSAVTYTPKLDGLNWTVTEWKVD